MRRFRPLLVAVLFLGCIATSRSAEALAISLSDGITTQIVADNMLGDTNPLSGIITITGAFDAFDINVITGLSQPILGTSQQPVMDLNQVSVNYWGGTSGSLAVSLTDTGFSIPGTGNAVLTSIISGAYFNGSITGSAGVDLGNSSFGSPEFVTQHGVFGGALGAFSDEKSTVFNYAGGNFSLTQTVQIALGAPGSAAFDLQSRVTAVPEPASILLLGLGLAGTLSIRRSVVR